MLCTLTTQKLRIVFRRPVKISVLVNLLCVWVEVRLRLVSVVLLKSVFLLTFCVSVEVRLRLVSVVLLKSVFLLTFCVFGSK